MNTYTKAITLVTMVAVGIVAFALNPVTDKNSNSETQIVSGTSEMVHNTVTAASAVEADVQKEAESVTLEQNAIPVSTSERPFSSLVRLGKASMGIEAIASVFEAKVGDKVALPLSPKVEGTVSMSRKHDDGTLAVGVTLDGYAASSAFIERSADGAVTGSISQKGNAVAYTITTDESGAQMNLQRTSISEILCAKVEGDEVVLGMEEEPQAAALSGEPESAAADQGEIQILNSNPGSSKVLYLNFGGETVTGSSWNTINGRDGSPIVAEPFANTSYIRKIWESVSADYEVFDVNVTTERAAFDNASFSKRCMVIFTPTNSWWGGGGGVAYVNSFGSSSNYMCWVFTSSLNGASETASHESGHQMGLRHDGAGSSEYYAGHNVSGVKWGTIMGASYGKTLSQWSKGEYSNASNTEDDLAKISSKLPYLSDDFGNSTSAAEVIATVPAKQFTLNGKIERNNDIDVFKLSTSKAGKITLTANQVGDYSNLDIKLQLLNSNGAVVLESDPAGPFDASISSGNLAAGTYYFTVQGASLGNVSNGYSNYGSLGKYQLSGTYPYSPFAPAPVNLSASDFSSASHVEVTWEPSQGATGYKVFRNLSNGTDGAEEIASVAQSTSPSFLDTSAQPRTSYFYFVSAVNANGDSGFSNIDEGSRSAPAPDAPTDVTATDSESTEFTRISWKASPYAGGYYVYRGTYSFTSGTLLGSTSANDLEFYDTTGESGTRYYYSVVAFNESGESSNSSNAAGRRTDGAPETPGNVSATKGEFDTTVQISWTVEGEVDGFELYRGLSDSADQASFLASVSTPYAVDNTAAAGRTYYYFVKSKNSVGRSPFSEGDYGFTGAVVGTDDNYENNDTVGNSFDLTDANGIWISDYAGEGIAKDSDWYFVRLNAGDDRLDVLLSFSASAGDIDLRVYDEEGNPVAESVSVNENEAISYQAPYAGGGYYIHVGTGNRAGGKYDLKWLSLQHGSFAGLVDNAIGKSATRLKGNNVFSSAARFGQTITSKSKRTKTHRAFFAVENEGALDQYIVTRGAGSTRYFKVRYVNISNGRNSNVTGSITSAGDSLFQPLEEKKYMVLVKPKRLKRTQSKRYNASVQSFLDYGAQNKDATRFKVQKQRSRRR